MDHNFIPLGMPAPARLPPPDLHGQISAPIFGHPSSLHAVFPHPAFAYQFAVPPPSGYLSTHDPPPSMNAVATLNAGKEQSNLQVPEDSQASNLELSYYEKLPSRPSSAPALLDWIPEEDLDNDEAGQEGIQSADPSGPPCPEREPSKLTTTKAKQDEILPEGECSNLMTKSHMEEKSSDASSILTTTNADEPAPLAAAPYRPVDHYYKNGLYKVWSDPGERRKCVHIRCDVTRSPVNKSVIFRFASGYNVFAIDITSENLVTNAIVVFDNEKTAEEFIKEHVGFVFTMEGNQYEVLGLPDYALCFEDWVHYWISKSSISSRTLLLNSRKPSVKPEEWLQAVK